MEQQSQVHDTLAPSQAPYLETPSGLAHAEWAMVETSRANCLLIGSDIFVDDALTLLSSALSRPVVLWSSGHPLLLPPSSSVSTLILRDIGGLDQADQWRLARWIDDARGTRIISTASVPPWPLVERGVFLEELYYRLNTVTVTLP